MAATSCVRQHGTEVGPTVLEGRKVRLFQVYPILQTCSCKLNSHCMALWFWLMRANPLLKLDPSTREGQRQVVRSEATSWDDMPKRAVDESYTCPMALVTSLSSPGMSKFTLFLVTFFFVMDPKQKHWVVLHVSYAYSETPCCWIHLQTENYIKLQPNTKSQEKDSHLVSRCA